MVSRKKRLDAPLLSCDWCSCGLEFADVNQLCRHLSDVHLFASQHCDQPNHCFWNGCDSFDAHDIRHLHVHVYYHAYHTLLKGLGAAHLSKRKEKRALQCQLVASSSRIPNVAENGYRCLFGDCFMTFEDINSFINHVNEHVIHENSTLVCLWSGCTSTQFKSKYKLADHMQVHTGGKQFACPQCGYMFANSSKLVGHCIRQLFDKESYKCTFCDVGFAAKTLLSEHMRTHVKLYHCAHCNSSFPTKANMRNHWLFKHSRERKFNCSLCEYSAKTQNDLLKHLHKHEKNFSEDCTICGATFRSKYGLHSHLECAHEIEVKPFYKCHICSQMFKRGQILTKHLQRLHDVRRLHNGRSVFRKDSEGHFVLQEKVSCVFNTDAPSAGFLDSESFSPVQTENRVGNSTPAFTSGFSSTPLEEQLISTQPLTVTSSNVELRGSPVQYTQHHPPDNFHGITIHCHGIETAMDHSEFRNSSILDYSQASCEDLAGIDMTHAAETLSMPMQIEGGIAAYLLPS